MHTLSISTECGAVVCGVHELNFNLLQDRGCPDPARWNYPFIVNSRYWGFTGHLWATWYIDQASEMMLALLNLYGYRRGTKIKTDSLRRIARKWLTCCHNWVNLWGLRIGQSFYAFIEFLKSEHGVNDIFYVRDEYFMEYYHQFLSSIEIAGGGSVSEGGS